MRARPVPIIRVRLARALAALALLASAGTARADSHGLQGVIQLAAADIAGYNAGSGSLAYRRQLIGFYVDDEERGGLFALARDGRFLLPLDQVLGNIGARLEERSGDAWIVTPGGEIELAPESLVELEDKLLIRMEALNSDLDLLAEFDQSSYALRVSLPWDPRKSAASATASRPTPDYRAPTASVRNLRADLTWLHGDNGDDVFAEYFTAGNLASGTWQTRIEQDRDQELTPFDYFWHRSFDNTQVLIGNSTLSTHPLLPSQEQTGAQVLYSNQGFESTSSRTLTSGDGARDVGGGTRRITGTGEPGSIAQLRINGGIVARTRVRLDGTFEFSDIELSTRGSADIKVLLLDRTSGVLLETLDYSRRGGVGLLNEGQHTVFAAAGEEGNPLNDGYDSNGVAGALQYRQGVTQDLTLEASYQDDGDRRAGLVGASMSLGRHWFANTAFARGPDTDALEFSIDGSSDRWRADLSLTEIWPDDDEERDVYERYGSFSYYASDQLTVGVSGRDAQNASDDERFLLPTASWSDGRYFRASAWPNNNGNYRFDSALRASDRDTLRYTYEEDNHRFDYRRDMGYGLDYYLNVQDSESFETRGETGLIFYSDNPLMERAQFGLVGTDNQAGYVVQWDARLLPGVYSRLQLRDNAFSSSDDLTLNEGFTVQWDLSLDFAVAQGRVVPADTQFGRADTAALSGPLRINGEPVAASDGIDRIVVIVNGVSHTALVQGGRYYVDGLLPGVYRVSLDSRHLPIQMVPAQEQVHWVELARAAATKVPFDLEVRFSIAGKVTNAEGDAQAKLMIRVVNAEHAVVATLETDRFGFYRADNLPPGEYRVEVVEEELAVAARDVQVDGFLFGQDISLP